MASYKRCPRGLEVQTLLFPRDTTWTATRARAWAREHGFGSSKVDTTQQYFRVRNRNPNDFVRGSFRTIILSEKDDVNAVVGCPLPGRESDRTRAPNGRRSRRDRGGFRFEARYAGDDQWRSGGGETFASMSDALVHAERTVRSRYFDAERARIVGPGGKTMWEHYPSRRGGRDVSRYDLSPEGKRWMAAYQDEGASPEVRDAFERLSRFDKAAVRFLLTENGRNGPPSSRDRRRRLRRGGRRGA